MGGDMQAQGHVQVLVNLIDFGMNVQEAGDEARVRHDGSAEPTGEPAEPDGGEVFVEPRCPREVVAALAKKGHKVEPARGGGFGGYQAHPDRLEKRRAARRDRAAQGRLRRRAIKLGC